MVSSQADAAPLAGEIWDAVLDPVRGREQAGYRPVIILSSDQFNALNGSLVIVAPLTGTEPRVRYQISVKSDEGGLAKNSTILPEQIRAIDISRLRTRRGQVSRTKLEQVRQMVFTLLSD